MIATAEAHGVRSYIFIPCVVYGPGEGFGNRISIQTVAIVKAALKAKRVYRVDSGRPVCIYFRSCLEFYSSPRLMWHRSGPSLISRTPWVCIWICFGKCS